MPERQGTALRILRREAPTIVDEELLRRAYGAYNARNAPGALSLTQPAVRWSHGNDGGFVSGHAGLRELWTREWAESGTLLEPQTFHENADGTLVVELVRRKRKGDLLQESTQVHRFTLSGGLIESMELG